MNDAVLWDAGSVEQDTISRTTSVTLSMLFISLLGVGTCRTVSETLGIPYIDDNVGSGESSPYFGKRRVLLLFIAQYPGLVLLKWVFTWFYWVLLVTTKFYIDEWVLSPFSRLTGPEFNFNPSLPELVF